MDMRSDATGSDETFPLVNLYNWLIGAPLVDRAGVVEALRNAVFAQTAPIVVGMLGTLLIAATAYLSTHRPWPLLWCGAEALLVAWRLTILLGAARHPKRPRRRAHFLLMVLGMSWSVVNGVGSAACILSGSPALMVMGGVTVAAVIGATATRNASTPRYATLALSAAGLPSAIACLVDTKMAGVVAIYLPVMMIGAYSIMKQNHRNLVRLFSAESAAALSARTDPLTGLGNRAHLNKSLAALGLAPLGRAERPVGVLCLDLDGFKSVNDQHGHLAGDELLVGVAGRLRGLVGASDVLARTGGDEFVVLMLDATEVALAALADRIIASIAEPFELSGVDATVRIGVSVGGALVQPPAGTRDNLLVLADRALYVAKGAGRGVYRSWTSPTVRNLRPAAHASRETPERVVTVTEDRTDYTTGRAALDAPAS